MIRRLSILKYALLLLLAAPAVAQTTRRESQTPNPSAIVGDKVACYNQAQAYVDRQNKESTPLMPGESWSKPVYGLDQAHYDAKAQVCYLQMRRGFSVFPPDSRSRSTVEEVAVLDAFEGKTIALFVDTVDYPKTAEGKITQSKPEVCDVNGAKCSSREEFNGLLWKLIPAFQPVDCHVEENGIEKPCKKTAN